MPVWVEVGEQLLYGIPANERRGFKVADDTRGEPFDPTDGERIVSPAALAVARAGGKGRGRLGPGLTARDSGGLDQLFSG